MDGAAALVAVQVMMHFFVVAVFHLFGVVPMVMSVTQAQMHRVPEIEMQACGFCLLPCHYTACYACHHCHLY